ncbi:MAG TPA: helix-turn-helix transcriptional regulator [Pirellulales bacterium]|nr:helix-turn-helix transcriptional regulator [Pirellulales bacterium]
MSAIGYQAVLVNGERLRSERKLKNLSQQQLADAAQISLRTLVKMERGEPASPRASIRPVARVLGVHWEYLALLTVNRPTEEATFDIDNPIFIVGLRVDKDFNELSEDEDVKPLLETFQAFPRLVSYTRMDGEPPWERDIPVYSVIYIGMKPITSALIEFEMDAAFIWYYLVRFLAEGRLYAHAVTSIYLPASYIAFWDGPPRLWSLSDPDASIPFAQLIHDKYGRFLSLTVLDDGTTVLTPREGVPSHELVPVVSA